MRSLTAKKTANLMDPGGQRRTILESEGERPNCSGPAWTFADASPAVFKTVGGVSLDVHSDSRTSTIVH